MGEAFEETGKVGRQFTPEGKAGALARAPRAHAGACACIPTAAAAAAAARRHCPPCVAQAAPRSRWAGRLTRKAPSASSSPPRAPWVRVAIACMAQRVAIDACAVRARAYGQRMACALVQAPAAAPHCTHALKTGGMHTRTGTRTRPQAAPSRRPPRLWTRRARRCRPRRSTARARSSRRGATARRPPRPRATQAATRCLAPTWQTRPRPSTLAARDASVCLCVCVLQ